MEDACLCISLSRCGEQKAIASRASAQKPGLWLTEWLMLRLYCHSLCVGFSELREMPTSLALSFVDHCHHHHHHHHLANLVMSLSYLSCSKKGWASYWRRLGLSPTLGLWIQRVTVLIHIFMRFPCVAFTSHIWFCERIPSFPFFTVWRHLHRKRLSVTLGTES